MATPSSADIKAFIQANMNNPAAISGAMKQYGVTLDQIQGATGFSRDDIGNFINSSGDAYLQGAFTNWATPTKPPIPVGSNPPGAPPATGTATSSGTRTTTTGAQGLIRSLEPTSTTPATPTVTPPPPPVATTTAAPSAAPASNVSNDIAALIASIQGVLKTPAPVAAPAPTKPTAAQLAGISASGQATKLISSNSPLLKSVQNQALVGANARGILNSSAATQAAMQAALAEAGRLGTADASNFLALTQTGMNNDSALARQLLQGQQDERLQTMRDNAALTTQATGLLGDQLDFARRDAAAVRDSNVGWQRDLEKFNLETTAARENQQRIWDRTDTLDAADRDRTLQGNYARDIGAARDALAARVSAIQNSDLPPDVKEAQINSEIAIAREWVNWTNEIYKALPEWKSEWAQFDVKVG